MTSKTRITMIATVAVLIVILAGMQTMQIQNVALAAPPDDDDCEPVPCWIKNTAGYWAEGSSTTIEYLYSIEWLIDEGIITLDTVSAVSDSEDLSTEIADLYEATIGCTDETRSCLRDMIWDDRDRMDDIESFDYDFRSEMYAILDAIGLHSIEVNNRLDSLETDDDQGTSSTISSSIEDELEDISDRISDLEFCRGQGPICDDDLNEIESDIEELKDSLDMLDSDISELMRDISKIERALESLDRTLGKLVIAVDELESHTHKDKDDWKDEP